MGKEKVLSDYLPLSESTFYILVALVEPLHGYGVMLRTAEISQGQVVIGPGTLYGAFSTLEKEGLISMVREEERRKVFRLTDRGKAVLDMQLERCQVMLENGRRALEKGNDNGEEL
jgi:DNA-binding PadR family transcriptional regulator